MIVGGKSRFLLKRSGAPSTCEGVVDVFRLTKLKNVIGRNTSHVDFYLNSSINKFLISRQHAVILLSDNNDGDSVDISLRDQGLNGTFVNDVKIQGTVQLKVGDTITFGHINGAGLKPGVHTPQPDSEFRFVLEEISDTPSKPCKNGLTSPLSNRVTDHISPQPTQPRYLTAKTTTTPESSPQLTKGARQLNETPVTRKSDIRVVPHFDKVTNQGREGMMVEIAGFSKLANSCNSPTSANTTIPYRGDTNNHSKPSTFNTTTRGQHSVSPLTSASPSGSILHNTSQGNQHRSGTSDNSNTTLVYVSPKPHSTTPSTHRPSLPEPSPTSRGQQTPIPARILYGTPMLSAPGNLSITKTTKENARNMSKDSGVYDFDGEDDTEDMAIESDAGSDDDIFALASVVQDKITDFMEEDDSFSPIIPDSQPSSNDNPNNRESGSPLPGLNMTRNSNSSIDEYTADEPNSPGVARSASPVLEVIMPFGPKGTKLKVSTRNGGKRKLEKVNVYSKKAKPTPSKSTPVNSLEIHVGLCSSIDCCQPQKKKETVAWVQCDDCDGWYHVDCVGCSYNKVKQSTAAFHCGCI